jgi:hypothetical protein
MIEEKKEQKKMVADNPKQEEIGLKEKEDDIY